MTSPFKAILFDFNGIIINDEPVHFELFKQVLAEEEITITEKDYWEKYLGFDDKGLIEAIYERDQKKLTPKKLKDLIVKKNAGYFPMLNRKMCLFEGVSDFIKKTSTEFDIAVVSGALRSEIDYVLKQSGLIGFFKEIVSANDTKHGKPNPEGYVMAEARLKKKNPEIRADNCLVIEDSHAGIEAANRAGMVSVGMTHTYSRSELGAADFVVDQFDEIWEILSAKS